MVVDEKLPINHQIIYQLQDVFNLLPDVQLQEFVKSVYVKTNDQMLVVCFLRTFASENRNYIFFTMKEGSTWGVLISPIVFFRNGIIHYRSTRNSGNS